MPERGVGAVPPQYLADQLTLFQPEWIDGLPTLNYWHPQIFSHSGMAKLIALGNKCDAGLTSF